MRNRYTGFTLIEVLVSILIFTIVSLFGLSFFTFGSKQQVKAKEMDYALNIAINRMELLKSEDYSNIPKFSSDSYSNFGLTFNEYWGSTEINNYGENYKIIFVTVTWTGSQTPIYLHTIRTE